MSATAQTSRGQLEQRSGTAYNLAQNIRLFVEGTRSFRSTAFDAALAVGTMIGADGIKVLHRGQVSLEIYAPASARHTLPDELVQMELYGGIRKKEVAGTEYILVSDSNSLKVLTFFRKLDSKHIVHQAIWREVYDAEGLVEEREFPILKLLLELFCAFLASIKTMNIPKACWDPIDYRIRVVLPWEIKTQIMTVTSSFDIRSSTFLMANAVRPERFSKWLLAITSSLRKVCQDYGGYFDKFTGDGVLTHFVSANNNDSDEEYGRLCLRAYECSRDMLEVFAYLEEFLQPDLSLRKTTAGAAIALAMGYASWSRSGGVLVVVGPGVVLACRASSGEAGKVYCANSVFNHLKLQGYKGEPKDYIAKEYKKEDNAQIWDMQGFCPGKRSAALRKLAEEHWQRQLKTDVPKPPPGE